jgi:hypothetical protein
LHCKDRSFAISQVLNAMACVIYTQL